MKFLSPVYSSASGSIGGITYSRNKGGMYTRTRAKPTNPNSIRQQASRAYLGNAVQQWATNLSELERNSWRNYAAQVPMLDKLGQMKHRTGQQMFIRSYVANMVIAGVAAPDQMNGPPDLGANVTGVRATATLEPSLGIGEVESVLSWQTNAILASASDGDGWLGLYIGPPVSDGVSYWKGPYQFATRAEVSVDDSAVSFTGALADNANSNGGVAIGQRRPVRLIITYEDGRVSQEWSAILPVLGVV